MPFYTSYDAIRSFVHEYTCYRSSKALNQYPQVNQRILIGLFQLLSLYLTAIRRLIEAYVLILQSVVIMTTNHDYAHDSIKPHHKVY